MSEPEKLLEEKVEEPIVEEKVEEPVEEKEVPEVFVGIKLEKKKRPPMSEERKEKLRENLRKARESKKLKKEMLKKDKEVKTASLKKPKVIDVEETNVTLQETIKKPKSKPKLEIVEEEEPEQEQPPQIKITNLTNKKKKRY